MDNTDIASLLNKIQERLARMEHKIDMLVINPPAKEPQAKTPPVPVQNSPVNKGEHKHRRERQMYKAVCADCQNECELPFKPTGDRPVYCHDCYALRKTVGSRPKPEDEPEPGKAVEIKNLTPPNKVISIDWRKEDQGQKQQLTEIKKPFEAKKSVAARRPAAKKKAGTRIKMRLQKQTKKRAG